MANEIEPGTILIEEDILPPARPYKFAYAMLDRTTDLKVIISEVWEEPPPVVLVLSKAHFNQGKGDQR
jgi:hypothetical protein